ncbi:MAG: TylF/MycF family methyltransferase [Thermoflexales bacterium]|nr:TylF/MycF family methyltransferase [Thermoflexales bacterium]
MKSTDSSPRNVTNSGLAGQYDRSPSAGRIHAVRVFDLLARAWRSGANGRNSESPRQKHIRGVVRNVGRQNLTYLSRNSLEHLVAVCEQIDDLHIPGLIIEAGCALGGSAIVLATAKGLERRFDIYDVFGMIPAPSPEDTPDVFKRYSTILSGKARGIRGSPYYGYESNLLDIVLANFKRFGIGLETHNMRVVKGLIQDTLSINEPVAMAHIDVDWYSPVKVSLSRIFPNLSVGGTIVLDDYFAWGGCKKATDEYLATVQGQCVAMRTGSVLSITRTS